MAIITSIRNGQGAVTEPSPGTFNTTGVQEDDLMGSQNDFVARAGTRDLVDDFLVVQRGAGANMSVDVGAGYAYVQNSSWTDHSTSQTKYWRVVNDATINVAIGANASGNPRIDIVCILVDTAAVPDANATNVASIVVTAGVPGATPAVPATPANSLKLAEVAVANGAVSIVTANITDRRVSSQLSLDDGFNTSMSRQAIMNPQFEFMERFKYASYAVTGPSSGNYLHDRWLNAFALDGGTDPTLVYSRQVLTAGDIANMSYYARIAPNGAGSSYGANSYHLLYQLVEYGTRYLCGLNKKVTMTFWARASVAGKRLGVYLGQNYGTGGAPTAAETINGTNWTLTSTWTKYTWTFTTNTLVGKTFGTANNDYIAVVFVSQWGTGLTGPRVGATTAETFGGNGTIDITGVTLNSGDTALPYMAYNTETELLKCQRYCYVPDSTGAVPVNFLGFGASATHAYFLAKLPTRMRIVPANSPALTAGDWIIHNNIDANVAVTALSIMTNQSTTDTLILDATVAAGLTAYRPYWLAGATANKVMVWSAEL